MINILIALLFGIVEGITEWLPVSSTGHMILLNEFLTMDVSPAFWEMFLVVIQLGAIIAVVILFRNKIFPFHVARREREKYGLLKMKTLRLWGLALIACVPAAIVGVLFDDVLDEVFYHWYVVAAALIVFGIAFLLIENWNAGRKPRVKKLSQLSVRDALIIGAFQLIAAIFPGTSRSGATIVGALLIGVARTVAAEFTFILAIPVMFGASLLKLLKFGFSFTGAEALILLAGTASALIVSLLVIRMLMRFIRTHDFKVFGYYRIILGLIVIVYFVLR
ncbi:MAG: undecaprenyl-diphosphate phosphatase [Lachnospiraceae bacterium]|nr:undecaprenyl-diphosphate phosphatase [Lachnospiraceae bacterium]